MRPRSRPARAARAGTRPSARATAPRSCCSATRAAYAWPGRSSTRRGRTRGTTRWSTPRPARILRRANLAKGVDGDVFGNYPGRRDRRRPGAGAARRLPHGSGDGDDPRRPQRPRLERPRRRLRRPGRPGPGSRRGRRSRPLPVRELQRLQRLRRVRRRRTCARGMPASAAAGRRTAPRTRCRSSGPSTASTTTSRPPRSASTPRPGTSRAGGDALVAQTDDGATTNGGVLPDGGHLDNANMVTLPDGQSPVMQMYLFFNNTLPPPNASPFRDVNGGDDASIVFHEYTHGLSNRLITTATGAGALDTLQAAAMGEGWSDWYAKDVLVAEGRQPDTTLPARSTWAPTSTRRPRSTGSGPRRSIARSARPPRAARARRRRARGLHIRRLRPHQGGRRRPRRRRDLGRDAMGPA